MWRGGFCRIRRIMGRRRGIRTNTGNECASRGRVRRDGAGRLRAHAESRHAADMASGVVEVSRPWGSARRKAVYCGESAGAKRTPENRGGRGRLIIRWGRAVAGHTQIVLDDGKSGTMTAGTGAEGRATRAEPAVVKGCLPVRRKRGGPCGGGEKPGGDGARANGRT